MSLPDSIESDLMIHEILNTSAPAGLKPGSSGYCTVKSSRGIPGPTMDLLESLSGYRHVFTPGSAEAADNPVNWGHYLLRIGGRLEHVLSRVSDCPLDYSGRSNKLAHHIVLEGAAGPAGPAWLLGRPGWMINRWDGRVEQFPSARIPPQQPRPAGRCDEWARVTGSADKAGWAGIMAESFLADPDRKVFLIYPPKIDVLALFEEAIALLPESRRWDVTFATYGASLPKTVDYLWSGIVAGSTEVQQSLRFVNALRIDLTALQPPPPGGALVQTARTGIVVKRPTAPRHIDPNRSGIPVAGPAGHPASAAGRRPAAADRMSHVEDYAEEEPRPPGLPLGHRARAQADFPWALVGGAAAATVVLAAAVVAFVLSKKGERGVAASPPPPPAPAASPSDDQRMASIPRPERNSDDDRVRKAPEDSGMPETMPPTTMPPGTPPSVTTPPPMSQNPAPPAPMPPAARPDGMPAARPDGVPAARPDGKPAARPDGKPVEMRDPKDAAPAKTILVAEKKPELKGNDAVEITFPAAEDLKLKSVTRAFLLLPSVTAPGSSKLYDPSHTFKDGAYSISEKRNIGSPAPYAEIVVSLNGIGQLQARIKPQQSIGDIDKTHLEHAVLWIEDGDSRSNLHLQFAPPVDVNEGVSIDNFHLKFDLKSFGTEVPKLKSWLGGIDSSTLRLSNIQLTFKGEPLPLIKGEAGAPRWDLNQLTNGKFQQLWLKSPDSAGPKSASSMILDFESTPSLTVENNKYDVEQETLNKDRSEIVKQFALRDFDSKALAPKYNGELSDSDIERFIAGVEGSVASAKTHWRGEDKNRSDEEAGKYAKDLREKAGRYLEDLKNVVHHGRELSPLQKELRVESAMVQIRMAPVHPPADSSGAVPGGEFFDLFRFKGKTAAVKVGKSGK